MAQHLANHLSTLTRTGTGEKYPSAAEVFLLSDALELTTPAQEVPNLLIHGWTQRPWHEDDEWRLVITDFFDAVNNWFLNTYPLPDSQAPACMPVIAKISEKLVNIGQFSTHTQKPLPPGWAEQIAWHGALLPIRPTG